MTNSDIRVMAKKQNVWLWQIAEELGITEFTFSRKLRKELAADEKNRILQIIEKLSKQKETA